jgi:hypothetical protein
MNKLSLEWLGVIIAVLCVPNAGAYLIQGLDLNIDYWAGAGAYESVIVIDWNNTNGPYQSEFHCFGFRWDDPQITVKDALTALEAAGPLAISFAYGGGFIGDIVYDQSAVDGDYHTGGDDYFGWWWAGHTDDGGQTWLANSTGVDGKRLQNGRIEGLNLDGTNWTSESLTIPEPGTLLLLLSGAALLGRSRQSRMTKR